MALHNIDRNSEDRGSPAPNTHDVHSMTGVGIVNVPRQAHNTLSTAYTPPGVVPSAQASLGQFIASGIANVTGDGSLVSVTTVPHGLGYAPIVTGVMNHVSVTDISNRVSVFLPTWVAANISGGAISFTIWLSAMADDTNVYFYMINATGSPKSLNVTYYLYKQPALQQ